MTKFETGKSYIITNSMGSQFTQKITLFIVERNGSECSAIQNVTVYDSNGNQYGTGFQKGVYFTARKKSGCDYEISSGLLYDFNSNEEAL